MKVDQRAIEALLASPAGPVGAYMVTGAQTVTQEAKRISPTSPAGSGGRRSGHLRSEIGWLIGVEGRRVHVDIGSPARTADGRQAPYGYFMNLPNLMGRTRSGRRYPIRTTPHLVPALDAWPTR